MKTAILLGAAAAGLLAQDKITVPFSDASRPRMVHASGINSCFTVEGYDGKDVVIENHGGSGERRRSRTPAGAEGMKRIDPQGMGLTAEEENNVIKIHPAMNGGNLLIRVPFATSLKLECMNGGELKVDHVSGDLELQNMNGGVSAVGVSGNVIAHSQNGKIHVELDRVTSAKPMSFSSMNGNIDVTLPADTKGAVHMKSDNGEIYSDFDVQLNPGGAPVVEDGRSKGGKYRVKADRTTNGTINGGGPDLTFKTFNGNIYIRKKK
jgi:hypothetical protein